MSFQGYTMPPPSLGLDLVSPIDNMDPASALELVNIFPGAGAPTVRLGYKQFCTTGNNKQIKFMHELPRKDGTALLVAADNNDIYSVTSAGVLTNISKTVGTYASGNWVKEIFANNIYLCNGVDNAQVYTGLGASKAQDILVTGVALSNLVSVSSYRERLYFTEKNTLKMWYHKTAQATFVSASAVLDSYDFQYAARRGGYLLFTGSYSNTRGVSTQDLFMAVTSEGEILMYSGYSPDDTAWQLVAHFIIGKPLGRKAFIRVNQDVWIITQQGIVPVSALFETDPEQALNIVSLKINPLITQYATQVSLSEMWQGFFWPQGRRVYISLPDTTSSATLLVYSIDTKAWTQFVLYTGEHAAMSCKFNDLPFYGSTAGIIYQGETDYADVANGTSSQSIAFSGRLAFSFYGSRGNYKAFKDIRPLLKTRRGITLNIGLDLNFERQTTLTSVTSPVNTFTAWGSGSLFTRWGIGAGTINPITGLPMTTYYQPWSSDVEYIYDRYAVKGQGHCAAIRFGGSVKNTSLQFLGFEIRYDLGGQV